MKRREEYSGLRRHRPKKPFRYEYIQGRFSGLTPRQRRGRDFDAMEKEQDGYLALVERYERYKSGRGGDEDE